MDQVTQPIDTDKPHTPQQMVSEGTDSVSITPDASKPVKPWHKYKGRYSTKDRHKNKGRGSKSGKRNLTAIQKKFLQYLPENNFSIEDTCKAIGADVHTAYMWLQDDRFIEQHWAPQVERYLPIIEMSHMGSAATNKGVRNVLAQLHILKKRHPAYSEDEKKSDDSKAVAVSTGPSPDQLAQAMALAAVWLSKSGLLKNTNGSQKPIVDVESSPISPPQLSEDSNP